MINNRGFILFLTFLLMTILTVAVGALLYMTTYETRNVGSQAADVNLNSLADAGVEKAHRAVRDDYLTTTSTGVADLRGADTALSVSMSNPNNMRYIDTSVATINNNNDQAIIRVFDSNYTNTRIISVELHARASRAGGSGSNPTLQVAYTTNGVTYNSAITQPLTSTSLNDFYTTIAGLTWQDIMSTNFRIRAMRTAGTRNINIDSMYLRVTYSIDTLKEPWATGSYVTLPVSLNNGTIQTITITDEERKVHLNYASQTLLSNLLTNLGVGSASTKATNIVNYRGAGLTNPFDNIEELQQVTAITAADYSAIKDYVTVYSFINTNVYRPTGPRAPININTAPFRTLKAIFDPLGLVDATRFTLNIIDFRDSTPFTCFYSSDGAVTTDFYDFVNSRDYLTAGERNSILDNSDASSLVPVSGFAGYNCSTTELCYASTRFYINARAQSGTRNFRVKTILENDGSHAFTNYTGDTTASGYRKESFE